MGTAKVKWRLWSAKRGLMAALIVLCVLVGGRDVATAEGETTKTQVFVWGDGFSASPLGVVGAPRAAQIAGGNGFTVLLDRHGAVWTWGSNRFGQLGTGTVAPHVAVPARVTGLPKIVEVAVQAESQHVLALAKNGTVWTWGYNGMGQLGLGDTIDRSTPHQVPGLKKVRSVAAGSYQSYAVLADRTVKGWGRNGSYEVPGAGGTVVLTPTAIGGLSGIRKVVSGNDFGLALTRSGVLYGWGSTSWGQLGVGVGGLVAEPTVIALGDVVDVAAGDVHSLAVTRSGAVYGWGYNILGGVGSGSPAERVGYPELVSGLPAVRAVAAADAHSVALTVTGEVWTWGYNEYGQLGDGTFTDQRTPIKVPGLARIRRIAVQEFVTIAAS